MIVTFFFLRKIATLKSMNWMIAAKLTTTIRVTLPSMLWIGIGTWVMVSNDVRPASHLKQPQKNKKGKEKINNSNKKKKNTSNHSCWMVATSWALPHLSSCISQTFLWDNHVTIHNQHNFAYSGCTAVHSPRTPLLTTFFPHFLNSKAESFSL